MDFEVDADITVAKGLPPEAFTSHAFAKQERSIWDHAWTCTPCDLAPGEHRPVELWGAPYILARGHDGVLRTFPNVCTHAWHTLVAAPAASKAFVCPQHGRRFDPEGKCLGQPGLPEVQQADHLRSLETHEWGPLAFICRKEPSIPFKALIDPVQGSLGAFPLDRPTRLPVQEMRIVDGNWKQHACNYLDQLHIPFIHGADLARSVHLDSYQTHIEDHSVLQWATAKDPALGFDPALLPGRFQGDHRVFALWWFLVPNLTLNLYPWGLSVNLYEPTQDPQKTRFHWFQFAWADRDAQRDHWHMDSVDEEDVRALTQVSRGLQSGEAARTRFLPDEAAVHWFHRRVWNAVNKGT